VRLSPASDDIPEFVAELRLRNDRIRRVEVDLDAVDRSPAIVVDTPTRAGDRRPRQARRLSHESVRWSAA
jgi:hypothetical protein